MEKARRKEDATAKEEMQDAPKSGRSGSQSINGRGGEGGAAANYTPQSNYTPIRII